MTPKIYARDFLDELGITAIPIDPFEICERLDIPIFESNINGIEGILIFDQDEPFIGLSSKIQYLPRRKFTVAHELGHLQMDVDNLRSTSFTCKSLDIENYSINPSPQSLEKNIEIRADQFASELLMPSHLISSSLSLEPCWDLISKLSQQCETSFISSAIKFIQNTEYSCCLIVSCENKISYYRASSSFRYSLGMESRDLNPNSFAYKSINRQNIPSSFECLNADLWIKGKNVTKESEILEWTLPVNSHGQVLTLLWDDECVEIDVQDEELSDFGIKQGYSYGGVDNFPWKPPVLGKSKRKS